MALPTKLTRSQQGLGGALKIIGSRLKGLLKRGEQVPRWGNCGSGEEDGGAGEGKEGGELRQISERPQIGSLGKRGDPREGREPVHLLMEFGEWQGVLAGRSLRSFLGAKGSSRVRKELNPSPECDPDPGRKVISVQVSVDVGVWADRSKR